MPLILGTNSIKDTGYNVANSLRFDDGSADNLTRTNSSTGSTSKSTISLWVKRSGISTYQAMWESFNNNENYFRFRFRDDGRLDIQSDISNATVLLKRTTRKFRDVSAWYHILVALDLTQSNANKVKLYINGTQETEFDTSTDLTSSSQQFVGGGGGYDFTIGKHPSNDVYFDGYMAEYVFVDGQALDPTSFGEFDSDSPNIWKPIDVSGLTFGTNGFYLDFENASSLGADVSGNSNNFTVNNLTSVDQSTDTCTNNFATLNPIKILGTATTTFKEGNLQFTTSNSNWANTSSTIAFTKGKWYAEFKVIALASSTGYGSAGVADINAADDNTSASTINVNGESAGVIFDHRSGQSALKSGGSSVTSNIGNFSTNDIVGMAVDMDNKALYVHLNGTYYQISSVTGVPTSGSSKTGAITIPASVVDCAFTVGSYTDKSETAVNFGSPAFSISSGNADDNGYGNFEYDVPAGYYALNTKNLAEFG